MLNQVAAKLPLAFVATIKAILLTWVAEMRRAEAKGGASSRD